MDEGSSRQRSGPAGSLVLGVDVGTGSVKVTACDERGAVRGRAVRGYPTAHPRPGRAEQDPQDWWTALVAAVAEAIRGLDGSRVDALAMSTQGGTLVPVDAAGRPVGPAILWTDRRCAPELAEVEQLVPEDWVYRRSGWQLGQGMNLLQIRRIERREPEFAGRIVRYLSVHDHLAQRLTGRAVLDPSNAGINQLGDPRTGSWDAGLLELAGVDQRRLGELQPAGSAIGPLLAGVADELGLRPGLTVVTGAHDQDCVALGLGAVTPGDVFVGSGTAWAVGTVLADAEEGFALEQSVSRYVRAGLFCGMWTVPAGGSSLQWWREAVSPRTGLVDWDRLTPVEPSPIGELPLFFPYLSGSPFPDRNPRARGVFWGLEEGHGPDDLAAAVMAGVALQVAAMTQALESRPRTLTLAGGAAASAVWPGYLAGALGVPVLAAAEQQPAARGAALLAGLGTGVVDPAAVRTPPTGVLFEPDDPVAWGEANARYRRLSRIIAEVER